MLKKTKKKTVTYRPLKLTKKRKSPTLNRFRKGVMNTFGKGLKVGTSQAEEDWLNKLGIIKRQVVFRGFNNKIYVVDGVDVENHIIYEFLGDYFHGNPKKYRLDDFNAITKKTYKMLYLETRERFQYFYDLSWKIFFVWESDWKQGKIGRYYKGLGDPLQMSNLTDFLDGAICVLNNPGDKSMFGALGKFKIEDGIDQVSGKGLATLDQEIPSDLTPEEKKIREREYIRNYMREYKKTYVQPEYAKQHRSKKKRRKHGTALITSLRRRKEAKEKGLIVTKNCYIIDPTKTEYKPKEEKK